jgi:hypothetical protein
MLVGILLLLVSVPAFAGIDNTHHSLRDYYTSGTTQYSCFACHGYPNPAGQTDQALLGRVGNFCYLRCHGSGGIAGSDAELGPGTVAVVGTDNSLTETTAAASGINALLYGHGLDWGSFPDKDKPGTPPSTWPYMDESGFMECTSCHDIHNNTYAPFLRAPLSAQATDNEHADMGAITDTFCVKCHTGGASGAGRYNAITSDPSGVHPVEMYADNSSTNWVGTQYSGTARGGRVISLKGTVFETETYWGTGLNGAKANSYVLGGKRGGTGGNEVVGCYTCHSVHMDVITAAAGSAKNVEPTGQTFKNLTVMAIADNNLKTALNDDLCIGCHGNTAQVANPGATAYYHPAGSETDLTVGGGGVGSATASYTVSTGNFDIIVDMSGKMYGDSGRLLCTSCHAPAHADSPVAGSLLLSPLVSGGCGDCHNAISLGTAPDSHHVYGTTTDYTQSANGGMPEPTYASDYPSSLGYDVTLTDGLQCWDCHVHGSDTAHNW